MKNHPFTPTGIKNLENNALSAVFSALDKNETPPDILISIGGDYMEIPITADNFAALIEFLEVANNEFNN